MEYYLAQLYRCLSHIYPQNKIKTIDACHNSLANYGSHFLVLWVLLLTLIGLGKVFPMELHTFHCPNKPWKSIISISSSNVFELSNSRLSVHILKVVISVDRIITERVMVNVRAQKSHIINLSEWEAGCQPTKGHQYFFGVCCGHNDWRRNYFDARKVLRWLMHCVASNIEIS